MLLSTGLPTPETLPPVGIPSTFLCWREPNWLSFLLQRERTHLETEMSHQSPACCSAERPHEGCLSSTERLHKGPLYPHGGVVWRLENFQEDARPYMCPLPSLPRIERTCVLTEVGAGEVQSLLIEVLGGAWLTEPRFCKGLQWLVIDKPYKNTSNNSFYLILLFLHFLYIAFGQCAALINKHTPSNEGMKLQNCYQAQNNSRSLLPMVT